MKNFILLSLSLILVIGSSQNVQAQTPSTEIQNMLEERDQEIKTLLGPKGSEYTDQQRNKLKDIINGVIDFKAMATYALGDTYSTLDEATQVEFVELFATIVRDQSLNKLDIYRADVSYKSIDVNADKARVETLAVLDEVRTPLYYTMKKEDGEWVITDMIIDDVSTAESYNKQFQRIINKRGFDALMSSLRKRAARG
ncbi:MlaC/ttg2D family ABC transporter substrate-binding protein [Balneola vulgaris]|uniref:MlaC/ttg2D family ABC transporter substrate-binding protein n=1 Tax=Balneola vulgaris TaxID=287535 RepID=UPI0003827D53|nr:ABC transporter substrate-binding protein [Balneola vulgaris]